VDLFTVFALVTERDPKSPSLQEPSVNWL